MPPSHLAPSKWRWLITAHFPLIKPSSQPSALNEGGPRKKPRWRRRVSFPFGEFSQIAGSVHSSWRVALKDVCFLNELRPGSKWQRSLSSAVSLYGSGDASTIFIVSAPDMKAWCCLAVLPFRARSHAELVKKGRFAAVLGGLSKNGLSKSEGVGGGGRAGSASCLIPILISHFLILSK